MSEYIGKICPFCRTEIKEGEQVKVCPSCGIAHHQGCWDENGGCTTFGCTQQNCANEKTEVMSVCANCGTPMGTAQAFCPNCGAAKAAPQPAQPQMAQPQMVQPQMAQPQMAQPQMAQPQMAQPQMAQPQMVQPQMAQPQMAQPQMAQPQPAQPQMAQPQMAQPQPAQPQFAQPQRVFCQVCGTELAPGQGFCPKCGQREGFVPDTGSAAAINQFNAQVEQEKKKKNLLPLFLGIGGGALVLLIALIALIASLFAGPSVDSITLDASSVELREGETYYVSYDIMPSDVEDAEVSWSSSNSSVATVSNGKITAKNEGTCTITAKVGNKKDTITVEVVGLKAEEAQVVGVYYTAGFLDEDDDFISLSSSFATLTLRSDLTGTLKQDSTTLNFTWYLYSTKDGSHYYKLTYTGGSTGDFFYGEGMILYGLDEYTLVFK